MGSKEFFVGFKEGQKKFGESIAIIVNSIVLSIVYFLGIGLTSIIMKFFGSNFLELNINKNSKTYWEALNLNKRPIEEYYRQF